MRCLKSALACRPAVACLAMLAVLAMAHPAAAEEIWTVHSGVSTVYLDPYLLQELDLSVTGVQETAPFPPEMQFRVESPHWSFAISPASDFSFRVDQSVTVPYGLVGGAIVHSGSLKLQDARSGRVQDLSGLEMAYIPAMVETAGGSHPSDMMVLQDPATHQPVFDLTDSMFDFHASGPLLWIHYMNMRVSAAWADRFGRPDLAGWYLGMVEVMANVDRTGGEPSSGGPPSPILTGDIDVTLGGLASIQSVAHDGSYPNGTVALSMATTACNSGLSDVPWLAPMQENHPVIAMALYRLMDGRFEQLGTSWVKHGFYALSNSDCTPCQHHSDGTFLGVGCSDTYGVVNNEDRNYLGPRTEVNPFTAVWTCLDSYFSGYQDDCIRRQGGQGLGPLDHRLNALDADLDLPGATYFYEADYLVRQDANREDNIGSRLCTMTWNGSTWNFSTPSSNNPLITGPAINRWGQVRTKGSVDSTDGYYVLGVQTTDLGGGQYHYEYALFNRNSDLAAHSFSLPVGAANITNIGFHDSDYDPLDDWQVTLQDGMLTWQTETQEGNPSANALIYDNLYNFRFDADIAPGDVAATIEMFKPHTPRQLDLGTKGPSPSTAVLPATGPGAIRLEPPRPNPLSPETAIRFSLDAARSATLEVFDPQGRRVRTLLDGPQTAGAHESDWNGADDNGRRLSSGVYYVRLRAGDRELVRSVTIVE